jgi:hypothetical protein
MPGLTAKVFRTYNASITLDKLVPWPIWFGIISRLLFVQWCLQLYWLYNGLLWEQFWTACSSLNACTVTKTILVLWIEKFVKDLLMKITEVWQFSVKTPGQNCWVGFFRVLLRFPLNMTKLAVLHWQLQDTSGDTTIEKIADYQRANKEVSYIILTNNKELCWF